MDPQIERVRKVVGFSLFGIVAMSLVGGAVLFGRFVGDAIGTAYVPASPSAADGLPMPPMGSPPGPPELGSLPPDASLMPPRAQASPLRKYDRPKAAPAQKRTLARQTKKS